MKADRQAVRLARELWQFGEPVHAVVYYAPERRAATDDLGLKGGLRSHRGWSDEDWTVAGHELRERGFIDGRGRITQAGSDLRQQIEDDTDKLAAPLVAAIGVAAVEELISLVRPLASAVMTQVTCPPTTTWACSGRPRDRAGQTVAPTVSSGPRVMGREGRLLTRRDGACPGVVLSPDRA